MSGLALVPSLCVVVGVLAVVSAPTLAALDTTQSARPTRSLLNEGFLSRVAATQPVNFEGNNSEIAPQVISAKDPDVRPEVTRACTRNSTTEGRRT
jgi:hypothetical protein